MRNIFATLMLLCCSTSLASATPLTLQQCIERGLKLNPQVQANRLAVDEATEGIYEAWGEFLPTVSVNYAYTELDDTANRTVDRDYLSQTSDSFSVRLSQPVFSGLANISGLNKARQMEDYRGYELSLMKMQLVMGVRTSFYELLRAQQLVEKWGESIGRLKDQKNIAQAWVDQKLVTRLRLLEVEVELSNAQQRMAEAKAALAIAEAKLLEWLGQSRTVGPVEIVGDLQTTVPVECTSLDECLDLALSRRPELKIAELSVSLAREEVKIIRARNLPNVSLDASWVDYQREYDESRLDKEKRNYYTVGVNVTVRPFQGGRNIFAYRKQTLAVQRYQQELVSRNGAVFTEVKSRFQQMVEANSRVLNAEKGLLEAREAYAFADHAAKLGVNSLDDLLTAELRLTQAEINKIEADHSLQQSRIQLDYATGNKNPFR